MYQKSKKVSWFYFFLSLLKLFNPCLFYYELYKEYKWVYWIHNGQDAIKRWQEWFSPKLNYLIQIWPIWKEIYYQRLNPLAGNVIFLTPIQDTCQKLLVIPLTNEHLIFAYFVRLYIGNCFIIYGRTRLSVFNKL